jgi:predicted CoA-binding protein
MTLARLVPLVPIAVLPASCGDKDKSSNQTTTTVTTPGYIVVPINKLQLQ